MPTPTRWLPDTSVADRTSRIYTDQTSQHVRTDELCAAPDPGGAHLPR
jgi:hypothetical protein